MTLQELIDALQHIASLKHELPEQQVIYQDREFKEYTITCVDFTPGLPIVIHNRGQ